ncbi:MAG: phenylalanine--tRNA ligase subunit beta [Thermoplasmata archaeon]
MPVISIEYDDLIDLLGTKIEMEKLIETIPMMGADIERVDYTQMDIEFFPDRPDLYSVEGVARALRGYLGLEVGLKEYPITDSDIKLIVDPTVNEVRPFIVSGLIRGVTMTDFFIQSLMDMQEKLHLTLGRKRAKTAIGVHDYKNITPPFTYKAVDPESIQFVPLGKSETMDLEEILRKHEKGREYAWTLEGFTRYPIILDANNEVLSFPPIINGILTMVTEDTKDIFLDLTGTDMNAVNHALNIISTALAERGGKIERVEVVYPNESINTPNLEPTRMDLGLGYMNDMLGTNMSFEEVTKHLEKMRFGVQIVGGSINTLIPAYRSDILHPIDLVEDVAISYGYMEFGSELPKTMTFGKSMEIIDFCNKLRTIMVGFGFNEVMTLTLSNEKDQFEMMNLEISERATVKNPLTAEHTILRVSLLPSLLSTLKANRHRDLPQRIFEVGIAVPREHNVYKFAGVAIYPKASFTEVKSLVEGILKAVGLQYAIHPFSHGSFIDGRCASMICKNENIGFFGELHPQVITNFELSSPIYGFELDVEGMSPKKN